MRLLTIPIAVAAGLVAAASHAADPLPPELQKLHQRTVDDGQCQATPLLYANYPTTVAPLSATDTLYILPCDFGIYNVPSMVYIVSTGDHASVRQLMFAQFDQDFGWIGDTVQFNPVFDPKTKTLVAHEFFDPAGDCGSEGTWLWRDYAFALVKYRYQVPCDHTHTYATWTVIWDVPVPGTPPRPQIGPLPHFFQQPN